MDLLNELEATSKRFGNCLAYVPIDQLSAITSVLCLLISHAGHQEEERFTELNSRFIHILEIVETLMKEYQKLGVFKPNQTVLQTSF